MQYYVEKESIMNRLILREDGEIIKRQGKSLENQQEEPKVEKRSYQYIEVEAPVRIYLYPEQWKIKEFEDSEDDEIVNEENLEYGPYLSSSRRRLISAVQFGRKQEEVFQKIEEVKQRTEEVDSRWEVELVVRPAVPKAEGDGLEYAKEKKDLFKKKNKTELANNILRCIVKHGDMTVAINERKKLSEVEEHEEYMMMKEKLFQQQTDLMNMLGGMSKTSDLKTDYTETSSSTETFDRTIEMAPSANSSKCSKTKPKGLRHVIRSVTRRTAETFRSCISTPAS